MPEYISKILAGFGYKKIDIRIENMKAVKVYHIYFTGKFINSIIIKEVKRKLNYVAGFFDLEFRFFPLQQRFILDIYIRKLRIPDKSKFNNKNYISNYTGQDIYKYMMHYNIKYKELANVTSINVNKLFRRIRYTTPFTPEEKITILTGLLQLRPVVAVP